MTTITIKHNILFFPDKEIDKELSTPDKVAYKSYAKLRIRVRWASSRKADLAFSDLNEAGLFDYVSYMRDERQMRNTTIGKQLGGSQMVSPVGDD